MTTQPDDRLREHPAKRFAPPERVIDLDGCTDDLLDEPRQATDGHRQITLAQRDSVTQTLFHFEAGSTLPDHSVDGDVTIHILEGTVEISTPENTYELGKNQILVLAPQVTHDLHAKSEARMLLTVHLNRKVERSERADERP